MGLITTDTKIEPKEKKSAQPTIMRRGGAGSPKIYGDYSEIDVCEGIDSKVAKLEMWIAKSLGERLVKTYPNRQWGVTVNTDCGLVVITCPSLSVEKGYHLHMRKYNLRRLGEAVIKAAGEILERHDISRGRYFNEDNLEGLNEDFKGNVVGPDSDAPKLASQTSAVFQ